MLTITDEAREYLHALLKEVAGRIPAGVCLRLDLYDAGEASITFSQEMPNDHRSPL